MAAKDDQLILNKRLEEQRLKVASTMPEADYFEFFTAEQILKDYGLSYADIQSGITDGGGDGGFDSVYLFVNGDLVQEDSDYSNLLQDVVIDLVVVQSKTSDGFEEVAIDKMIATTSDLFDTSHVLSSYKTTYNASLLQNAQLFQKTYQNLAGRLPRLRVHYYYASKGDTVHPNVTKKSENLKGAVKTLFSSVQVDVHFLTARNLIELARRTPKTTRQLAVSETISAARGTAFIALTRLKNFYSFVREDDGSLAAHIFEANVRDYLGDVSINKDIQETLQNPQTEDFWWLNNGVTILATEVTLSGKSLTIQNAEIVNGLQTSREIYDFFTAHTHDDDERDILVRVVVPSAEESRFAIIRATNSQNKIAPASLRATDLIHRDIEDFLRSFGLYYDRRKNYYKNQGVPMRNIIGVSQLAQAVGAIVLRQPNTSRARPSSLINDDEDYERLFNSSYPIEVYRASVEIINSVESFLKNHSDKLSSVAQNDLKYYVAMLVTTIVLGKADPTPLEIAGLAGASINDTVLEQAYQSAKGKYDSLGGDDTVAKGSQMLINIVEELQQGSLF